MRIEMKFILIIFILLLSNSLYSQNIVTSKINKADTLSNGVLKLFLAEKINEKIVILSDISGRGKIPQNPLRQIYFNGTYVVNNKSYEVQNINYTLIVYNRGFIEEIRNVNSKISVSTWSLISRQPENHKVYLYVSKIILKNGICIDNPVLENQRYILINGFYDILKFSDKLKAKQKHLELKKANKDCYEFKNPVGIYQIISK